MFKPRLLFILFPALLLAGGCAATFQSLDDDGNGGISPAEAGDRLVRFQDFDSDRNGELDPVEYARAEEATRQQRELEAAVSRPRRSGSYGGIEGGGGFGS